MSKTIERELRMQADPYDLLPHVRLLPKQRELESAYQLYDVKRELTPVGKIQLSRWNARGGRPIMKIESWRLTTEREPSAESHAAMLAILAMSAEEGRMLVSDDNGSSQLEMATWCWLTGSGLAVIEVPFKTRLELNEGEPVFDGVAYAQPVTSRG